MMSMFYMQKGLIEWFMLEPKTERKARVVETVCRNLYKQVYGENSPKYKYSIIHPLVKFGILEYNEDSYRLSPSCALYKGSKILFCNIPQSNLFQCTHPCLYNSGLGIEVYENSSLVNSFLQQYGINSKKFKLTSLLQKISLAKTIEAWQQVKVLDTTGYQTFDINNTWQSVIKNFPGVYKINKEEYARPLLMISKNNWRAVSANWNDFAVAVLWSKIHNNFPFQIQFRQKEGLLCLNGERFPLVLERLLLVNTVLEGKFNLDFTHRQYYLSANEFAALNKIFNQRISVI